MLEIFVDADGCPVKDEVLRVAARYGIRATFVANAGLWLQESETVRLVLVSEGADAADDWIVEHLAERAVPGDAIALLSNGAFGGIHAKVLAALAAHKAAHPGFGIEQVHFFPLGGIKTCATWARPA